MSDRSVIPASAFRCETISRHFAVPAALPHEFVPNVNVVCRSFATDCEAPFQSLLISAALFHAFDQLIVIDDKPSRIFHRSLFAGWGDNPAAIRRWRGAEFYQPSGRNKEVLRPSLMDFAKKFGLQNKLERSRAPLNAAKRPNSYPCGARI